MNGIRKNLLIAVVFSGTGLALSAAHAQAQRDVTKPSASAMIWHPDAKTRGELILRISPLEPPLSAVLAFSRRSLEPHSIEAPKGFNSERPIVERGRQPGGGEKIMAIVIPISTKRIK